MRVYKQTYTKPLPEGAKMFTRKGTKFAKFKDTKGRMAEARFTKSGVKILLETAHWHIEFSDNLQIRRHLKAFTNERASERLADKIDELLSCQANNRQLDDELSNWLEKIPSRIRKELIKFGLLDPRRSTVGETLSEHIEEFRDYLTKKERNPKHIKETVGTLRRIFDGCGFVTWTDISPDKLKHYLDGLRDGGKGISKRRYNGLLGMTKYFCKWMVKQRKATSSPIDYLDGLDNPQTDKRHPRRAIELNDFRRFLDAALAGPKKFGMSGRERNFVYRFTAETGLRKVDIRERLRVQDCTFKERKIVIKADRIKNKQDAVVYLKPATAAELQQYCANKLPHTLVFHLTDKTEKMVRFDLANTAIKDANGIEVVPAIPYVDNNGDYFDFHAIRHQCASLLGMNPDTPEVVRQQLMRHKTPEMVRHYTHASEDQQREAINALPDLTQSSKEKQEAVKTGTDDKNLSKSCFPRAPIRSNTDNGGEKTLDSTEKMALCVRNEGALRTVDTKLNFVSVYS